MNQKLVIDALRSATKEQHRRLQRIPVFARLSDGIVCSNSYRRILEAFYGYYKPLEPILIEHSHLICPAGPYHRTRRTDWLMADLFDLGHDKSSLAAVPQCKELPVLASDGDFAGCLYVIEGSSLGGRVIERRLQTSMRLETPEGRRFFRGYGAETRRRWQEICRFLTAVCRMDFELESAIDAAEKTFDSLSNWFRSQNRE